MGSIKNYDKKDKFYEGLAAVNIGFKDVLTDQIWDPREGYYRETICEGKWGYINERGEEVIPVIYDEAGKFSGGMALVKLNVDRFFIDKAGNKLHDFNYDTIWGFREGIAFVRKSNKYGFINTDFQEIIPLIYDQVYDFVDGLAPVKLNALWGYINTKNEFVIPLQYSDASNFYKGRAKVKRNGKFGCIDKKGVEIFPCQADELSLPNAGVIETMQQEKYIYYDLNGKQITPPYCYSNQFYTGNYCIVGNGESGKHWFPYDKMIGSKWGVIDNNGVEVVPLTYDKFTDAAEHMKRLPPIPAKD